MNRRMSLITVEAGSWHKKKPLQDNPQRLSIKAYES